MTAASRSSRNKMRGRMLAIAALSLVAPTLVGCSGDGPFAVESLPCPHVRVLAEGERFTRFRPQGQPGIANIELEAQFVGVDYSQCEYDIDDEELIGLSFDVVLLVAARRGPAAEATDRETVETVPYFVAVVGPDREVVTKQAFMAEVTFPGGVAQAVQSEPEEITLDIPVSDDIPGWQYEVVVGFQLTPEQLAYERALRDQ